jgi:hypothetical protein
MPELRTPERELDIGGDMNAIVVRQLAPRPRQRAQLKHLAYANLSALRASP